MCGIAGYLGNDTISETKINIVLKEMYHRGPDANGSRKFFYKNFKINLLHSRLKIIDLSEKANQPYSYQNLHLIFNGEIYNYRELKDKLIKKGYRFNTSSDTEVLIKYFHCFREKCFQYFEGMWSLAIWDNNEKKMYLSRDRFGEKPLYFFKEKNSFYFGSEIKFIKSLVSKNLHINQNQINKNLFLGFKSLNKTNDTFYNNVFSLDPSSYLILNYNLDFNKKIFYRPILKQKKINFENAVNKSKKLLIRSLDLRMRSDVPIAFCLSGGIDSALLAGLAKREFGKDIATFSLIENDNRYDESENINKICKFLNIRNHKIEIKSDLKNFIEHLSFLNKRNDSPVSVISYYIQSLITKQIAKSNFKVSISGVAADEIFSGYYEHFLTFFSTIYKNKKLFTENLESWKTNILPYLRNEHLKNYKIYIDDNENRDLIYDHYEVLKNFSKKKYSNSFHEEIFCKDLMRNRMLNELFHEITPVILKHDDINSMTYSIENRSPYLDTKLINFILTLDNSFLIKNGFQKIILRNIAKDYLPSSICNDRKKIGYNAAIESFIDFNDKRTLDFILEKGSPIYEYIDYEMFKKLIMSLKKNKIQNHISKFLFSFFSTKIFLEQQ
jgi:asparagine synthase (glutamine-hydrolysing)